MSVQAISSVIRDSQAKGSTLLVLIMIANHAGNDDWSAWPSVRLLAEETRLSERAVQYALRRLEDSGELAVERGGGPGGANLYRVQILHRGVQTTTPGGATAFTGGAHPVAPEPSLNRQENRQSNTAAAAADLRPTEDQIYLAARINAAFGQRAGRITIPALQMFNSKHGVEHVTATLRELHGFPPADAIRSPYAYLAAILEGLGELGERPA